MANHFLQLFDAAIDKGDYPVMSPIGIVRGLAAILLMLPDCVVMFAGLPANEYL